MADDPNAKIRAAVAGTPATAPSGPGRPFIEQTAAVVASTLQIDPLHVGIAIAAGLRSARITTGAVLVALAVGALAAGQMGSPRVFLAFAAGNWWITLATVVTAAIRTHGAYNDAVKANL